MIKINVEDKVSNSRETVNYNISKLKGLGSTKRITWNGKRRYRTI